MKRLREAKSGVFCGPLRLLAHEVYDRLNREWSIPCQLITGEEQRGPTINGEDAVLLEEQGKVRTANHIACTVEMTDLNKRFDVAVIDEIQMIADSDRGWAWTQALLGLQANEIHLCGEETAVPLVRKLLRFTHDTVQVHRYQRLNPLQSENVSLQQNWKYLQTGDCVIAFSREKIFELKKMIERQSGHLCAVIYGALPPEIRAHQAQLFNDPNSRYKILVASDAVGMGLNLSIRRIIFESISKYNGTSHEPLSVSQVKQIAGRAGRYATFNPQSTYKSTDKDSERSPGWVTTFQDQDLGYVKECLETDATDMVSIRTAGLHPTLESMIEFAKYLPKFSMEKLLER